MAVRHGRRARLRRAARGSAGFVALACAVAVAAAVSATWPAVLHAGDRFMSGGASGHGEAAAGDHLQTLYHWWLVGHQLEHGNAPWHDPYSFRPEASPQPNFAGWPFGLTFWPLGAAFGSVVGWNVLQLVIYVLAALLTCAWLRELGLPRGAALAGGVAFAIAPYRVAQSVGHLLGPISILLPLMLWAIERARRGSAWWLALAGAAIASIPLSGQVHLALGAIPFFVTYAVVRLRSRILLGGAALGVVAAVGAGILVRQTLIVGSTQSSGRSLDEVSHYSARWGDFFARSIDHARSEQFVFLGWVTPLIALAGLAVLVVARRYALAAVLALGALVPILLAVGTHLPVYSALWHVLPPFRFPRVPERLLPMACLCIAALVAFAVARVPRMIVAALAVVVLLADLHVRLYGSSVADAHNEAYETIAPQKSGRLLELPVFDPGVHYGSVYVWYDQIAQRERPGGYSTTAPMGAKRLTRRLERLNCGDWSDDTAGVLRRLDVRVITFHNGLFVRNAAVPDRRYFALRGLFTHGWNVTKTSGAVWKLSRAAFEGYLFGETKPRRNRRLVFCQGWYGNTGHGWPMSEEHAPFWVYGSGRLQLRFTPSSMARRVRVDGKESLRLRGRGWHLVTVDVDHLVRVGKRRVGATILGVVTCPSRGSPSRRRASCP